MIDLLLIDFEGGYAETMFLQLGFLAEPIPWWLPPLTIGLGLLFLGPPQVDRWLGKYLGPWRSIQPVSFRISCLIVLFIGAGLIGWATLGDSRWQYAQYLLLVGRAVEGATVINIFVKMQEFLSFVDGLKTSTSNDDTGGPSSWQKLYPKLKNRIRERIPRIVASILVFVLSIALLIVLLSSRPEQQLLVQVVFVYTLMTFSLTIIGTAWIMRRLSNQLDPFSFIGVPLCVAGGELYNVPAAFDLFASPALGGPISGASPAVFSTIGWTAGALSALGLLWWSFRQSD